MPYRVKLHYDLILLIFKIKNSVSLGCDLELLKQALAIPVFHNRLKTLCGYSGELSEQVPSTTTPQQLYMRDNGIGTTYSSLKASAMIDGMFVKSVGE